MVVVVFDGGVFEVDSADLKYLFEFGLVEIEHAQFDGFFVPVPDIEIIKYA